MLTVDFLHYYNVRPHTIMNEKACEFGLDSIHIMYKNSFNYPFPESHRQSVCTIQNKRSN